MIITSPFRPDEIRLGARGEQSGGRTRHAPVLDLRLIRHRQKIVNKCFGSDPDRKSLGRDAASRYPGTNIDMFLLPTIMNCTRQSQAHGSKRRSRATIVANRFVASPPEN